MGCTYAGGRQNLRATLKEATEGVYDMQLVANNPPSDTQGTLQEGVYEIQRENKYRRVTLLDTSRGERKKINFARRGQE